MKKKHFGIAYRKFSKKTLKKVFFAEISAFFTENSVKN
jgi:hypothetical protein